MILGRCALAGHPPEDAPDPTSRSFAPLEDLLAALTVGPPGTENPKFLNKSDFQGDPDVRTPDVFPVAKRLAVAALLCVVGLAAAHAQTSGAQSGERPASAVQSQPARANSVRQSEMACSGFIEHRPPSGRLEIIGAEQEQEQRVYAEGDYLYISGGAQAGARVGQEFSIIRPRGRFKTRVSRKSGSLGMYTQEIGRLRIVRVKQNTSVALVTASCDNISLGDLLRETPARPVPAGRPETSLDIFAEPTGKQTGRIVLARDGREVLSRDDVVFIDLGSEDNVRVGDFLTIYRPLGTGDVTRFRNKEVTPGGSRSFESPVFRGGKYSNKAQRVKDPVDGHYKSVTNTPEIEARRPALPRKIVGEVIIISVEARTAAAVVTRTALEIHTGDFVEVQ